MFLRRNRAEVDVLVREYEVGRLRCKAFRARGGLTVAALDLNRRRARKVQLEQNQSKRAFVKACEGGFFLRKKPFEGIASGYSYSGFAIGDEDGPCGPLAMESIEAGEKLRRADQAAQAHG